MHILLLLLLLLAILTMLFPRFMRCMFFLIGILVAIGSAHAEDDGHHFSDILSKHEETAECSDLIILDGIVSMAVSHCAGFKPIYESIGNAVKQVAVLGDEKAQMQIALGVGTFNRGMTAKNKVAACEHLKAIFDPKEDWK